MNFNHFKWGVAALALPLLSHSSHADPKGNIGYISAQGGRILHLSSGKSSAITGAQKANLLSISPMGTAIFWVPIAKKPDDGENAPANAYTSVYPYQNAQALPFKSETLNSWDYSWSPSGTTFYLSTDKRKGAYTPKTGNFKALQTLPASLDARGQLSAYSTDTELRLHMVKSGRERVLFSVKKPKALFDAIKRAKYPKKLEGLTEDTDIPFNQRWQLAGPALSPDGKRAYFASNAGTGYGAAGNGSFGIFAIDIKSGKISVLSNYGQAFGRPPSILQVSPDGKRLLMASSAHSSAADNSFFVDVIDLETQKSRELLTQYPNVKSKANDLDSAVWSPDGKYVATSVYFYNPDKVMKPDGTWVQETVNDYTMAIFDAATGKPVKFQKGAQSLSWFK